MSAASPSSMSAYTSYISSWLAPRGGDGAAAWSLKLPVFLTRAGNREEFLEVLKDWGTTQVYKKGLLVALNGPVTFVTLWFGVAVARRAFIFADFTTQVTWRRISVGLFSHLLRTRLPPVPSSIDAVAMDSQDSSAAAGVDPESAHSAGSGVIVAQHEPPGPPSPRTPRGSVNTSAWTTLRTIIKHSPSPGVAVHIVGYNCCIVFVGAGVFLWAKQPNRSVLSFLGAFAPAVFTSFAIMGSEYANRIEAEQIYVGDFEKDSRGAAFSSRLYALTVTACSAFGWVQSSSVALSGLETMFSNFLASVADTHRYLLSVTGFQSAMVVADGWTEAPLKAAAVGAALFAISFLLRKIDAPPEETQGTVSVGSNEGGGSDPATSPPPARERLYSYILRLFDA
jgi:hypothetical protein